MSGPVRPVIGLDNAYFFEGTGKQELRIQCCNACGALRHPSGPACHECDAYDRGHVVASGEGAVYSFTVIHAPKLPGKELPLVVALLDLPEGVRIVAEVTGVPPEGENALQIGERLVVDWNVIDEELTLPIWRRP